MSREMLVKVFQNCRLDSSLWVSARVGLGKHERQTLTAGVFLFQGCMCLRVQLEEDQVGPDIYQVLDFTQV